MDYNTQRTKLILPEYGRNVQIMVEYAKMISDKEERNRAARAIISVMGNMNPHLRDINDFKHKLWDHLAIMSNFELDFDSPYPIPTKETLYGKPNRVPYNEHIIKYKYYGKTIELIIKKAAEMPEGEERDALVEIIANHMKKSYLMWNKDIVDDDIIFKTIDDLTQGKIPIKENLKLTDSKSIMNKNKNKKNIKKSDNHDRRDSKIKR